MAEAPKWIWSPPHNDHYYVTYDLYGKPVYTFSRQSQSQAQPQSQTQTNTAAAAATPAVSYQAAATPVATYQVATSPSGDSAIGTDYLSPTAPVSPNVRRLANFIGGNPRNGWTETFDESYIMRTGIEARRFFVVGKVFAMLYSEAAGGQSQNVEDEAYSMARFGQRVHSQIRRFIVVQVCHGFVYALGISTYTKRGTNKPGCVPAEHAITYFSGNDPVNCYFDGEYANGMTKDPIEVIPAEQSLQMKPQSRIRFSKIFPVEMNIKVKDIGRVHPEHTSKLLEYFRQHQ